MESKARDRIVVDAVKGPRLSISSSIGAQNVQKFELPHGVVDIPERPTSKDTPRSSSREYRPIADDQQRIEDSPRTIDA